MYPTYLYRGEQFHSLSTMDIPVVKEFIGELVLSKFEKINQLIHNYRLIGIHWFSESSCSL